MSTLDPLLTDPTTFVALKTVALKYRLIDWLIKALVESAEDSLESLRGGFKNAFCC